MSGFWLGVFLGLAVWKLINALAAVALLGTTRTYSHKHVVGELVSCVLLLTAAVLVYTGVV